MPTAKGLLFAAIGVGGIVVLLAIIGTVGGLLSHRECGRPYVKVSAWVDSNGNGKREPDEPVLAGVKVAIPASMSYDLGGVTDGRGIVPSSREVFAPCGLTWNGATAEPPEGYVATPPLSIRGKADAYAFGFKPR